MKEITVTSGDQSDLNLIVRAHEADSPYILKARGAFTTRGGVILPSGSQLDLTDSTLTLDPDAVTPDQITDDPLFIIASETGWAKGKTPEEASAAIPRGESIRGGTIIGNHSRMAALWAAQGKPYRAWGVSLQGHECFAQGVTFRDFGALRRLDSDVSAEAFMVLLSGARAWDDTDALPPDTVFDPAHITDCSMLDYNRASNDQVSAFLIMGAASGTRMLWRRSGSIINPVVRVPGDPAANRVQAATIYLCQSGKVTGAVTPGCNAGYYADYFQSRKIELVGNDFRGAAWAVRLLLSPGGPLAEQFHHEDYTIFGNQYDSANVDVELDTLGPSTDRRYIRNINVDAALSLENHGATNVLRTGASSPLPDPAKREGCNPFGFLQR